MIAVTVPRRGWSMEEGTFVEWLKQDGDPIKPGDALFVLESEKAAENIEAIDAGTLRLGPDSPKPGDVVKVGQVIAYLTGSTVLSPPSAVPASQPAEVARAEVAKSGSVSTPSQRRTGERTRLAISPRARRAAREKGIDPATLQGTGKNGRIRERDVRTATPTAAPGKVIPHTGIRRTIAARMLAGVTQAAPVTLNTRADATNLVNLRKQFKATDNPVPSYTDLIVKLTALTLRRHPLLQAQWRDDGLFVPDRIDIAIAVDSEAGLTTPIIREADSLSLSEITKRSRELIAKARAGLLVADDMRDGTFTITNLGMFNIDSFTPIIPLPQSAILGVSRIIREPAVIEDRIVPRDLLTLSLTFDHRTVDGSPAARFLDAVRQCLEQPVPHLLE